jgi:predicted RNA-binding protein YlqC (UPF0109 family)
MKNALQNIVTAIVENTEAVQIDEVEENGVVTFSIKVAKEDMGKIIGKEGKVIRGIRNVMKIPAMKNNKKVIISLVEDSPVA